MAQPRKVIQDLLADAEEIIRKKNAIIIGFKRTAVDLRKQLDEQLSVREEIYRIAAHDVAPPAWTTELPKSQRVRGTPVGIWSDWHYGETIKANPATGLTAYNAKVAQKRIRYLVDRTIDLSFNHMGDPKAKYPGIIICLGGDMVGGDIHEELKASNDRTPLSAVNDLTDLLGAAIEELASKFGRVYLPCVVGNHGRTTRKPEEKFIVENNYDYHIYLQLIRYFRKNKRVQFTASTGPDCSFRAYSHRFCLTHGDRLGAKGGDGIIGAIGPIMRGVMKIARQKEMLGMGFDTLICCHYHDYMTLPRAIVNGSLKGPDEFSSHRLRVAPSVPIQALLFVHPKYGMIDQKGIYLEEPSKPKADAPEWVSWQAAA